MLDPWLGTPSQLLKIHNKLAQTTELHITLTSKHCKTSTLPASTITTRECNARKPRRRKSNLSYLVTKDFVILWYHTIQEAAKRHHLIHLTHSQRHRKGSTPENTSPRFARKITMILFLENPFVITSQKILRVNISDRTRLYRRVSYILPKFTLRF